MIVPTPSVTAVSIVSVFLVGIIVGGTLVRGGSVPSIARHAVEMAVPFLLTTAAATLENGTLILQGWIGASFLFGIYTFGIVLGRDARARWWWRIRVWRKRGHLPPS